MDAITITAETAAEASATCIWGMGWTPEAIREVDSGDEGSRAWRCFANAQDAKLWDNQR